MQIIDAHHHLCDLERNAGTNNSSGLHDRSQGDLGLHWPIVSKSGPADPRSGVQGPHGATLADDPQPHYAKTVCNMTRDRMESLSQTSVVHPLAALGAEPDGVLALITGVEGPSYRPLGAMMAILGPQRLAGSLSSGCVEGDIAHHAKSASAQGRPVQLRYGLGSPFRDIQLPCGGGLDILLVPAPDRAVLREVLDRHTARQGCTLSINATTGAMALNDAGDTGWQGDCFHVRVDPELAFHVFGKGPEAATFAALAHSAGFPTVLLSPDDETLAGARCERRQLVSKRIPDDLRADDRTAVVLFFHDHDWEPPILLAALASDAFYIGAQGSLRARATRDAALSALGVDSETIERINGPIGLVRSARDARTLAVSVLAEVLAEQR